jgi:hypothetical protein
MIGFSEYKTFLKNEFKIVATQKLVEKSPILEDMILNEPVTVTLKSQAGTLFPESLGGIANDKLVGSNIKQYCREAI